MHVEYCKDILYTLYCQTVWKYRSRLSQSNMDSGWCWL